MNGQEFIAMARNPIQFQRALSLTAFLDQYGPDQYHWPKGFVCPGCGNTTCCQLSRVLTLIGNVKNAITGVYHAISRQHAPRYLAEFEYRFNQRHDLRAMIPRFLTIAARKSLMPNGFLKMAEYYA